MDIDIKTLIEENKANQQALVNRINEIDQEKQQLLQETLRLDGIIRFLRERQNGHEKPA